MRTAGRRSGKPGELFADKYMSAALGFLGIALMSAQLYWRMVQVQPKQVELRVIDGDHEWMTFRDALANALQYVDAQCARNQ